jgi:hypothetical protein
MKKRLSSTYLTSNLSIICSGQFSDEINELTPWNRALLDKLIVSQLGKEFSALWIPKFDCRLYRSLPLSPILNQLNPVHILTSENPSNV